MTIRVFGVVLGEAEAEGGAVCAGAVLPAAGLALCADAAIGRERARRLKAVAAATNLRMFELR